MSFLGSKPNPLQNLPIGAQRTIRTLWNHYREREKQFRANPPSSLSDEPHELTDEEWQRDYERREREREWSRQARALVEEHLAPLATNEEAALALADMLPPGFWRFGMLCTAESFKKNSAEEKRKRHKLARGRKTKTRWFRS